METQPTKLKHEPIIEKEYYTVEELIKRSLNATKIKSYKNHPRSYKYWSFYFREIADQNRREVERKWELEMVLLLQN